MDIFNVFSSLVKESVSFKAYKALHPVLGILCFLALLPFIVLYAGMLLVYTVMATVYKLIHSIFDYLYAFVHGEGKSVKQAAQAIIYLVAFPLLFALKVVYSVMIYPMVFFHFLTSHVGYVATLGGIKYSPFMLETVDRFDGKKFAKHCVPAVIIFVVIALLLMALTVVFEDVAVEVYKVNKEETILSELVKEMERAKANNKISSAEWNEFASDFNAGKITADNYAEYTGKYLGSSARALWDVAKEAVFYMWINVIPMGIAGLYVVFTSLYVSIYSNVIKRRKDDEVYEEVAVTA